MDRVGSVSSHLLAGAAAGGPLAATHRLYIGCYSEKQWWVAGSPGAGLYAFDFDDSTGQLALTQVETSIVSPSWSVVDPAGRFLVCVTEKGPGDPVEDGRICSYAISAADGSLALVSAQPTHGRGSNCVNLCDGVAVCTNFFEGSLTSFVLSPDGELGAPVVTSHPARAETGIPDRQTQAHPHDVFVEAGTICIPDLGLDRLMRYSVDNATAVLTALPDATDTLVPGDGPRSLVQHPTLPVRYCICELSGNLHVLSTRGGGKLAALQTVKTYREDAPGGMDAHWPDRWASTLCISPDGQWLYAANRRQPGDERPGAGDDIAIFKVSNDDGMLTLAEHYTHIGQKHTRNMRIIDSPAGPRWLLAAHQDSDCLAVYQLSRETGGIGKMVASHEIGSAGNVCVAPVRK